ncbi:type II secretion system protein GspD, partial [Yersinia kristensenii]
CSWVRSVNANSLGSVFNKRVVNNAVLVKSGETVVVGGLLDKKISKVINKLPFLGDIPLIGGLFRQSKEKVEKSNLILFIRPTILRDTGDYSQVTADKYTEHSNLNSLNSDITRPIEIVSNKINNDAFNTLKNDIVNFYQRVGVNYDSR